MTAALARASVLTVSKDQWNGTTHAFCSIFGTKGCMIVKHRDVIQPVPTKGPANRKRHVLRL